MNQNVNIIRELREAKGLSQSKIAKSIGITQQQYSRYEKEGKIFPLKTLIKLADYYNISMDYILGRTNCKESVDIINKELQSGTSTGKLISDIYSLSDSGKDFITECVELIKIKENNTKSNR